MSRLVKMVSFRVNCFSEVLRLITLHWEVASLKSPLYKTILIILCNTFLVKHLKCSLRCRLSLSSFFSSYFSLSLPLCLSLMFPFSLSLDLVVWLFCGLKSHWLLCCEGALPSSIAHIGTCILPPPLLLYHLHHLPRYAQASRLYLS